MKYINIDITYICNIIDNRIVPIMKKLILSILIVATDTFAFAGKPIEGEAALKKENFSAEITKPKSLAFNLSTVSVLNIESIRSVNFHSAITDPMRIRERKIDREITDKILRDLHFGF